MTPEDRAEWMTETIHEGNRTLAEIKEQLNQPSRSRSQETARLRELLQEAESRLTRYWFLTDATLLDREYPHAAYVICRLCHATTTLTPKTDDGRDFDMDTSDLDPSPFGEAPPHPDGGAWPVTASPPVTPAPTVTASPRVTRRQAPAVERTCQVCGARFTARRSDARFCGAACRQRARRLQ